MKHINIYHYCWDSNSEGLELSKFPTYFKLKSLFVKKSFSERIHWGSRHIEYSCTSKLWASNQYTIKRYCCDDTERAEKFIAKLPTGINAKLEYKMVNDDRLSNRTNVIYSYEEIYIDISVSQVYIETIKQDVIEFQNRIMEKHSDLLGVFSHKVLTNNILALFVNADNIYISTRGRNSFSLYFSTYNMVNLNDITQQYALAQALVDKLNTYDASTHFYLENLDNFSLSITIKCLTKNNTPPLQNW